MDLIPGNLTSDPSYRIGIEGGQNRVEGLWRCSFCGISPVNPELRSLSSDQKVAGYPDSNQLQIPPPFFPRFHISNFLIYTFHPVYPYTLSIPVNFFILAHPKQ